MHKFIDLFSGCGGLSLGLSMAGMEGQFAIERDAMAFETFAENFLSERKRPVGTFVWPSWLEKRAWAIDDLLAEHRSKLGKLKGKIDVLAGGPPCQGFSFAGKRQESDPRNLLFEKYVQVVEEIQPSALILENVPGMLVAHKARGSKGAEVQSPESFYDKLKKKLEDIGYEVHGKILDASQFGVPQRRPRLIVVGLRKRLAARLAGGIERVFELLEAKRKQQLWELKLPDVVSAAEAISDLKVGKAMRKACTDPYSPPGFEEAVYRGPDPKAKSGYQAWAHKNCSNDAMDSMRLARHRDDVRERFSRILSECRLGVTMAAGDREKFGLKKHRIHPMHSDMPAPTITTLPDDVLHYSEPRILTVRESARLQSFPDWFRFRGKFTTGGSLRTKECPRYTQVGNAVPPLLGRAIGLAIQEALREASVATVQQAVPRSVAPQKRNLAVA
ncbi:MULTISPECIES: DNA cytosine methyltransferase [Cupriavidus]|uniref:DNA cytosine methyltransferase n=1 Tax=Cupriavidus pauculus TaxID=82633 RepID=UPI001C934486|nr:DNA cytosine methyltransferase [Cupriavidus pauculus]MBY4731762.1 DNA cytosine methyltransferase [Cupriavidus pauculus]